MKQLHIPYQGSNILISLIDNDTYYAEDGRVFFEEDGEWHLLYDNLTIGNEKVSMHPDGLWRDRFGTIHGLRDTHDLIDPNPVCGVGPFSLPIDHPFTDACRIHDYQFSSPAYQVFHTESESNKQLEKNLRSVGASKFVSKVFYFIVEQLGMWWWENKKTKNK